MGLSDVYEATGRGGVAWGVADDVDVPAAVDLLAGGAYAEDSSDVVSVKRRGLVAGRSAGEGVAAE